jgi:hypothetical protein
MIVASVDFSLTIPLAEEAEAAGGGEGLGFRVAAAAAGGLTRTPAVHPKLRNINFHNVTHSLISPNPRERMFVVQISLLFISVTFLSLISWNLSIHANHPRSQPKALTLRNVSICGVSPSSSSYATC